MAAAISNWYHSSLWTRNRQVQVAPLLNRAEENARLGRPPAEAVVINMGDILADDPALLNAIKPKKHETLFGPSLGDINPGPAWTSYGKQDNNNNTKDELTQETVKAWIAKSKEPSQPTTTLQALVNLKRPSIRLLPLDHTDADTPEDAPSTHHGLEFEYDLDAAKGRLLLEVISPKADAAPILIYEAIVEGGFSKQLKVEDGAVFDLAKLEEHNAAGVATDAPETSAAGQGHTSASTSTPPVAATTAAAGSSNATAHSRKRFSAFAFKKKNRTSGPAAPVVDAQTPAPATAAVEGQQNSNKAAEEDDGGVRVRIRIEALDESDKSLASPNAQTTYLHMVRMGPPPAPAEEGKEKEEDTRQWMVKVVKREATIGLHTFHLHEIYGLATGNNSSTTAPAQTHTYPPNANADDEENHAQAYDFAGTECVLCLSEPREVVLLPCRHLVACKDCAINMIEFGAGGTLTHNEEAAATTPAPNVTTTNAANAAGGEPDLEAGQTPTPAAAVTATTPPAPVTAATRRKRKAKGWFCPVCRQPYTSMLRITTTPPEAKKLTSDSDANLPTATTPVPVPAPVSTAPVVNEPAVPPAAVIAGDTNASNTGNSWKPSFLKGLGKTSEETPATENTAAEGTSSTTEAPAPEPARTSADPLGATQQPEQASH